jgi:hypothetical protein
MGWTVISAIFIDGKCEAGGKRTLWARGAMLVISDERADGSSSDVACHVRSISRVEHQPITGSSRSNITLVFTTEQQHSPRGLVVHVNDVPAAQASDVFGLVSGAQDFAARGAAR